MTKVRDYNPSPLSRIHLVQHVMHEDVFYPPHSPRTESEDYAKIHHQLTIVEDKPCFICGIRNSQLGNPKINVHGVKEMETHHLFIEWALMNAADVKKINAFFHLALKPEDVSSFVDHSRRNLVVLCDRHHRHKEAGIHEISFPIWIAQKFVRDDFTLLKEGN